MCGHAPLTLRFSEELQKLNCIQYLSLGCTSKLDVLDILSQSCCSISFRMLLHRVCGAILPDLNSQIGLFKWTLSMEVDRLEGS